VETCPRVRGNAFWRWPRNERRPAGREAAAGCAGAARNGLRRGLRRLAQGIVKKGKVAEGGDSSPAIQEPSCITLGMLYFERVWRVSGEES